MLLSGIQDSYILSEDEAIVLRAHEEFTDTVNVEGNLIVFTFGLLSEEFSLFYHNLDLYVLNVNKM